MISIMNIVEGIVLGLIQGVTEFLPISSSGHLLLIPKIFNFSDPGLAVDAVLHISTAIAILLFFWKDWWLMLKSWKKSESLRKIILASIPAAIVGLIFGDLIESVFHSPWVVVVMLLVVAGFMWWVESNYAEVIKIQSKESNKIIDIDWIEAFIMGVAQVIALIPGTSRSGVTIATGMWRNVNRTNAAKFAFLLGVPVSLGAGLFKLRYLFTQTNTDWVLVITACLTTLIVSIFVIKWLLNYLQNHTFKPFIIYRVVLALIVSVILLIK